MTQISKIRNKKGEVATDTTEKQRIIRDYYKQLMKEIATHSSILAWAWWATVHGETESDTTEQLHFFKKQATICEQNGQPGKDGQTFRKVQFSKTEQEETENRS